MSRILLPVDSKWYSEINLVSYMYETELENKIIQHSDEVFKEFIVLPFKKTLETVGGDTSTPDLIMIRKDFSEWWLVEVEKADHPISHVESQIKVFRNAKYNSIDLAEYIVNTGNKHGKLLDEKSIHSLISTSTQKLMVIIDEPKQDWKKQLNKYGAKICVFQVYLNAHSEELYRIHGDYPYIYVSETHCRLVKSLPNLLEIYNPDVITCTDGEEIDIIDNQGKLTRWSRKSSKSKVYLVPLGRNPLHVAKDYVIDKDTEGRYHIRLN